VRKTSRPLSAQISRPVTLLAPCDHSLGWLVAPTYELTLRIFKRLVELLHTHMPERVIRFDPRGHSIVVANLGGGISELRAKSADKPVSLLGEALDWMICDEAVRLPDDVWYEHLSPRLIDRHGWCLVLSTPAHASGWFYDLYRRGQKNRDANCESWAFPTAANPHIAAELIEQEQKRLAPETFESQFLAQFLGAIDDPCDVCDGPKEGAHNIIIVHGDEKPLRCPACNDYVDERGETVVALRDGKRGRVIIVHGVDPDDPLEVSPNPVETFLDALRKPPQEGQIKPS